MVAARLQKEAGRLVQTHKSTLNPQPYIERLKIMTTHSSASMRVETPHETERTQITISDALKRRAQSVLNDRSIDPQWRSIIRYALEINDPSLPDLVRRADAGETILDKTNFSQTSENPAAEPTREKIEALAEIICGAGDQAAVALFVLMGKLEEASDPRTSAHTAKHFAFTRCGELNVFGMVDAQLTVIEGELLASDTLVS